MIRKVKVNLFGAHGDRQIDITPTGFPTRHVRMGKPTETPPVCLTPNLSKLQARVGAFKAGTSLTAETVMTVMQAIRETYGFKWILFDEILKVATVSFKIRTSGAPLREVLRELYRQGHIEHKTDPHTPRSKQGMFRILKTDLHQLLAEVDALLGSRNGGSQMIRTDLQCTRCAMDNSIWKNP